MFQRFRLIKRHSHLQGRAAAKFCLLSPGIFFMSLNSLNKTRYYSDLRCFTGSAWIGSFYVFQVLEWEGNFGLRSFNLVKNKKAKRWKFCTSTRNKYSPLKRIHIYISSCLLALKSETDDQKVNKEWFTLVFGTEPCVLLMASESRF